MRSGDCFITTSDRIPRSAIEHRQKLVGNGGKIRRLEPEDSLLKWLQFYVAGQSFYHIYLREAKMLNGFVCPIVPRLKEMIVGENITGQIKLHGWVEHARVQNVMCNSQLITFSSIREFVGGAVLKAMALGKMPLMVDYAGPCEQGNDYVGFKIPTGLRESIIVAIRKKIAEIIARLSELKELAGSGLERVRQDFTWHAKVEKILANYNNIERKKSAASKE